MTCVITLWHIHVTSLTTFVSTMHFRIEIIFILTALKSSFKGLYDKQNLTLTLISYEIYDTLQRLISKISYEMTTHVRSSIWGHMETVQTQFRCHRMWHLNRVCTVCLQQNAIKMNTDTPNTRNDKDGQFSQSKRAKRNKG